MFRKQALLAILLLLAVSLAGCGGNQLPTLPALPSAAEAQKAVCDGLTVVNSNVTSLGNISPSSTVNDIKALKANIDIGVQAIKAANSVLNRQAITDLTNNYDNLALQINGLTSGQVISPETEAQIEAGVASVQVALTQARTALSCP